MFDFLEKTYKFLTTNQNPVVTGMVSLYGLGILTWLLRSVPARIKNTIWGQITTSVTINNADDVYYRVLNWIGQHKMHRFMRDYSVGRASSSYWSSHGQLFSLGYGTNIIWYGRPIFVRRSVKESTGILQSKEVMELTILGRNAQIFKNILEDIRKLEEADTDHFTVFRFESDSWRSMVRFPKRPLTSVVTPANHQTIVCEHIEQFWKDKEWYAMNGVPHRTGVMFYGPPGTGKTSFVTALCSHYNRDCYVIDMNSMSDATLIKALSAIPANSFVLMEDIDAAFTGNVNRAVVIGEDKEVEQKKHSVTLAGLLNAIDGICTNSSRILFATTNHMDRLDPALVREGRFNLKMEMSYMNNDMLRRYLTRLYPTLDPKTLEDWSIMANIAPCKVQQLVFDNRNNPTFVLEQIAYRTNAATA